MVHLGRVALEVDDAVFVQERQQSVDQLHRAEIVDGHPLCVDRVVPGVKRPADHGDSEIDDDEVVFSRDALHPSNDVADNDIETGFLSHLAACCFGECLTELDSTPRDRPFPDGGPSPSLDQQQGVASPGNRADADLRAQ